MMIVQYPSKFRGAGGNVSSFFLAGDCQTDWRNQLIEKLQRDSTFQPCAIINPYCYTYTVKDNTPWEAQAIRKSDCIIFWFAPNQTAPGTLFELGIVARDNLKPLIVGIDPKYPLRDFVLQQLKWYRPELTVYESLDEIIQHGMIDFINTYDLSEAEKDDLFLNLTHIGLTI